MDEIKQTLLDFGSYAGLAAFIGLAILALLYFSQARDVRRLREWAGRAPERDAEVQQLAAQYAAQAVTDALEQMPVAPASVSADNTVEGDVYVAVDSATDQHQVDEAAPHAGDQAVEQAAAESQEHEESEIEAPGDGEPVLPEPEYVEDGSPGEPQLEPEHEVLPTPVVVNGDGPGAGHGDRSEQGEDSEHSEPAIAASAGTATPPSEQAQPTRRPSTPAAALYSGGSPTARSTTPVEPPPLPPRPPVRLPSDRFGGLGDDSTIVPAPTYGGQRPPRPPQRRGDAVVRRAAIVLAGLALSVAVVFGAVTLFGGDSPSEVADRPAPSAVDSDTRINRAAVRVAVLNGTRTDGLAAVVGDQVVQAGFKLGTVSNALDHQEHIESVIFYADGFKQEAREVSKEVAIKPIKAISEETQVADPAAQVVIIVGADIDQ